MLSITRLHRRIRASSSSPHNPYASAIAFTSSHNNVQLTWLAVPHSTAMNGIATRLPVSAYCRWLASPHHRHHDHYIQRQRHVRCLTTYLGARTAICASVSSSATCCRSHRPFSSQSATAQEAPSHKPTGNNEQHTVSASSLPSSSSFSSPLTGWSRLRWMLLYVSGVVVCAVIIRGPSECKSDARIVYRFIRTWLTFTCILIDFKWTWYHYPDNTTPGYRQQTDEAHRRTAERLLNLALHNKGLYIKTGQYLCSMNHALPAVYMKTLRPLQDQAPTMDFDTVQQLIMTDFPGESIESLFSSFDSNPVAAASIAQVHHATLQSGQEVAVKLQYPSLEKEFVVDLFAHWLILKGTEFFFPQFQLSWMHDEIAENLTKELDFIHEGHNAEQAQHKFKQTNNHTVYIPKIYWTHTTKRVLTMEWVEGVKINDTRGLRRLGVSVSEAVHAVISSLSEQIFLHGFVHCDPHPGNLFIRRPPPHSHSSVPFQVILLDFGLCRQMRESVRLNYCALWEALIMRRDEDVIAATRKLGVEDDTWELIALTILMRPYRASTRGMANKLSPADLNKVRNALETQMSAVTQSLQRMPRELLLVLRNQNYLRALNYELGTPINRFKVMARMAVRGRDYRNTEEDVREMQRQSLSAYHQQQSQQENIDAELALVRAVPLRSSWRHYLHAFSFEWHLFSADLLRWLGTLWFKYFADVEVKRELKQLASAAGEQSPNAMFGG